MARLFNDGAEMRDLCFWDNWTSINPADVTVASALPNPFVSAYYYRIDSNSAINALYHLL